MPQAKTMTLREARVAFTHFICQLCLEAGAYAPGYEIALGEGMDRRTVNDPTSDHMAGSLHDVGLAQDIVLYKHGTYLTKTEDYEFLGVLWESWGRAFELPLYWGGRFTTPDGNHFSFGWNGKK